MREPGVRESDQEVYGVTLFILGVGGRGGFPSMCCLKAVIENTLAISEYVVLFLKYLKLAEST